MWTLGKGWRHSKDREWRTLLSCWTTWGSALLSGPKPGLLLESIEGFTVSRQTYEEFIAKPDFLLVQIC